MTDKVNTEFLILGRGLRSMTQVELSEKSGLDQGRISRYEGGIKVIPPHDLEAIAHALEFPVAFFYRPGKRYGAESGEIFHRKRRSLTSTQLGYAHDHLNRYRLDTEKLLEVADVEFDPHAIPTYDPTEFNGDIENIAERVRAAWKLADGPIENLVKVLEKAYCFIYAMDFGTDRIDEVVQQVPPMTPIVLINSQSPSDRLRFSLAHMLGHLVMHHNAIPYEKMEEEADQFAAAFLMPRDEIEKVLKAKKITIEYLLQIKPFWKVSIQALIRRALDIGVINERRYTSLFQALSRAGYRKNEPYPLRIEKPMLFKELYKIFEEDLNFTESDVAEILSYSEEDFIRWYLPEHPKHPNNAGVRLVEKTRPDFQKGKRKLDIG